jgi:hypothetical protein
VTVTDTMGCQTTSSLHIDTVNVQCGNAGNKVMVCHNGNVICVAAAAVQAHLNHADNLGTCAAAERTVSGVQNSITTEEGTTTRIIIYPNPVRGDHFYIKTTADLLSKEVLVSITDLGGRKLLSKRVKNNNGNIEMQLNKPLTGGIYLVRVNNHLATKLVIEK